jgi:uncharacterized iron-regulated protein
MMKNFLRWMFFLMLGGFLLSGCVRRTPPPAWVSKILMMNQPIGEEEIFIIPEGDRISFSKLIDDLSTIRVVLMGETHDQVEHHRIEMKVLQGLLEKGKDVALGMEMFERSQQPILDHWSQGLLTEEEFLKEVNWDTTWGMDYDLYKGILDEIRSQHLKVLGLNIERDLVRKVAQSGMGGLSFKDKEKLPEMDLTDRQLHSLLYNE